jgi:hypothetical protein
MWACSKEVLDTSGKVSAARSGCLAGLGVWACALGWGECVGVSVCALDRA